MSELWTKKQVAQFLQVTPWTINYWMREGRFPSPIRLGFKTIRWRSEDIVRYLAEQPVGLAV